LSLASSPEVTYFVLARLLRNKYLDSISDLNKLKLERAWRQLSNKNSQI